MKKHILVLTITICGILLLTQCKKTPNPVASFTTSATSISAGESVTFTNTSTDAYSYAWTFGDGGTSTDISPTHVFSTAGSYVVKLVAYSEDEELISEATATITVNNSVVNNDISIYYGTTTINNSGTLYLPSGNSSSSTSIWSSTDELIGIKNESTSSVTINSVSLSFSTSLIPAELTLKDYSTPDNPLSVSNYNLTTGNSFRFYARIKPVFSGARNATLTVTYNTTKTYTITIVLRARAGSGSATTEAEPFKFGTVTWDMVYGGDGTNDDEYMSGMVADASGNIYFSSNVTGAGNGDIMITRVNADGTLGWSKIWSGTYLDRSPDCGQNAETGGTANAIDIDDSGNIYVSACMGNGGSTVYKALVLKINSNNGDIMWEKLWSTNTSDQQAYGLDVKGNYVYVTGTENSQAFVVCLNESDGSIFFQRNLNIDNTSAIDRGYVVKADNSNNIYLAGWTSNYGFLTKLSAANTASPVFEWTKKVDIGYGGAINSMDIDASGDIYLSCNRRGALSYFSVIKVTSSGTLSWGKTYPAYSSTSMTNTSLVKVIDNDVYVGGSYDPILLPRRAGLLLKLTSSGTLTWAGIYTGGLNSDDQQNHWIKGMAIVGNDLYIAGNDWSGSGKVFFGYFYDGKETLTSYSPSLTSYSTPAPTTPTGSVTDASSSRSYSDAPSNYVLQSSFDKVGTSTADSDNWLLKINL